MIRARALRMPTYSHSFSTPERRHPLLRSRKTRELMPPRAAASRHLAPLPQTKPLSLSLKPDAPR